MKKILFIVPYPIGVAPSQRFRFEQYFEILLKNNYTYDAAPFWSKKGWSILYQKNQIILKSLMLLNGLVRRCFLLFKIHQYQLIFLHREAMPLGPPLFELIISKIFKKKIIYDFDDAIWLPNISEQNSLAGKLKYHQKVASICRWSWKVSCGNAFLVDFAKKYNPQVYINPTTIDTSYHKTNNNITTNQPVTIGWTGSHSTLKYMDSMLPILKDLKDNYGIGILIISNQKPDWEFDDYEFIPWNKQEEIEQLDSFDIGIMPLDDTIWEQGKCGFKALQYMAMEIPAVVSNVGVNKEIVQNGKNGYLCANSKEWIDNLTQLILSEDLRTFIGKEGRKRVMENYSVRSNSALFLSLFE